MAARGKMKVKRHELDLVPRPLTVCLGSSKNHDHEKIGSLTVPVEGCYRVFPDSIHSENGGRVYSLWCPICTEDKNGRRAAKAVETRSALLGHLIPVE